MNREATVYYTHLQTPAGKLLVACDDEAVTRIAFPREGHRVEAEDGWEKREHELLEATEKQLESYFEGKLQEFDLPLAPRGTAFQESVWAELCRIPYGETISYGELARRIGKPTASRAVGAANGANPIPIVIPCHRVIGTNGALTGFGGGISIKEQLLDLESPLFRENLV